MYTEAHEKIREDPEGEKAEKKETDGPVFCTEGSRQQALQDITYEKDGDTMKVQRFCCSDTLIHSLLM